MASDYKTMTVKARVVLSICAALVALVTPGGPWSTPTIGAAVGPVPPTRVVSLVPAVTEMLFALGAGDQVVGVSSFDTYPPEAKSRPKVGALIDPDFERILSLRPDLVIVYGSQTELMTRLERARIPIFKYLHGGLADITSTIRTLGVRLERSTEGNALASQIERDLDAVRKSVAGKRRPRTALLYGREPGTLRNIYASAGIGFMHDMLLVAGGDDIFGDIKRQSVQATAELLLARAPEVIVEVHAGETWSEDRIKREREVWKGLLSVPAVKTGRIHFVFDDRLAIPGPRVAEAVRLLAQLVHGDRSATIAIGRYPNSTASLAGTSPWSNDSLKNRSSAARPRVP